MEKKPLIVKWLSVGSMLLLLGPYFVSGSAPDIKKSPSTYKGNWLYVGGSGPGNYTKIQDAIDDSSNGDTVFVYDDSSPYTENLVITKEIYLKGENRYTTEIHPPLWDSNTITITTNNASLRCFTICNAERGVVISSSYNVTIDWNNIVENDDGISVSSSTQVHITNNTFDLNHRSLSVEDSKLCTIDDNIFYPSPGIPYDIIRLGWPHYDTLSMDGVNNNSVRRNLFIGEQYYMSCTCWGSQDNIISDNVFTGEYCNRSLTIWYGSERNMIFNNSISHGISIENSHNNTIQHNTYIDDGQTIGISLSLVSSNQNTLFENIFESCQLSSCRKNLIYHNYFIDNYWNQNVDDDGENNTWNGDFLSGGNYWFRFQSDDDFWGPNQDIIGSDGILDTPRIIVGDSKSYDYYPLKYPYGPTRLSMTFTPEIFGSILSIKNLLTTTAFNVHWTLALHGGRLICLREYSGVVKPILPNETITIRPGFFFFGLGAIEINITVWAENAPTITKEINGFLFLFFFKVLKN